MKRKVIVVGAVLLFIAGILAGRYVDITQIIAKAGGATPTSTPIPTITPTLTPMTVQPDVINEIPSGNVSNMTTVNQNGPRDDIIEISHISAAPTTAQVGEDIGFSVTIKNQVSYKKLIQLLCFNSSDGTFGCARNFNLYPGESFQFNNSGRFTSGGIKSVWITWSQDGQNFYRPVNGGTAKVTIQN